MMGADVKDEIYESLLMKNAEDPKSGPVQYFTPRALIRAMVECVRPKPMRNIADHGFGTEGFFSVAYDFIADKKNYDCLGEIVVHRNEPVKLNCNLTC